MILFQPNYQIPWFLVRHFSTSRPGAKKPLFVDKKFRNLVEKSYWYKDEAKFNIQDNLLILSAKNVLARMIDTVISCEEIIFLLLDQTNRVYLLYLDVMELIKYSTQRGTDTVHSSTLLIIFYIVSTYITTKVVHKYFNFSISRVLRVAHLWLNKMLQAEITKYPVYQESWQKTKQEFQSVQLSFQRWKEICRAGNFQVKCR